MTESTARVIDIVSRIECGDRSAEDELVNRFARGVYLILLKRTGDTSLASDLRQDTFIVALRKLRAGEVRNPSALSAFIRQTAVNICNDHFRREKRYVQGGDEIISSLVTHRDHKARAFDAGKTRVLLEHALDELTVTRDREILRRFYLADEDKAKICTDLALSATHFDRVLYRARQRIRAVIQNDRNFQSLMTGLSPDG